jgi:2-dehydro-3-deoxyphosphogluconate aldolase/(4S)-4-hydroxy-2-oxoglutarate aldolase
VNDIFERLRALRIVPVISLRDAGNALPLIKALTAGGLPCAEITFRTSAAADAIRLIAQRSPATLLGAGTILTIKQAEQAVGAGARFIVTPGFNPKVVDHCLNRGIPIIPGCLTPGEMEQAIERGLTVVKFFPAEQSGGIAYIRAVSTPYPMLRFLPTGGIGPGNLQDYLSFEKVLACGGSWMAGSRLIEEGRFGEIERLCAEAMALAKYAGEGGNET